jgi:hypothetical protein
MASSSGNTLPGRGHESVNKISQLPKPIHSYSWPGHDLNFARFGQGHPLRQQALWPTGQSAYNKMTDAAAFNSTNNKH